MEIMEQAVFALVIPFRVVMLQEGGGTADRAEGSCSMTVLG